MADFKAFSPSSWREFTRKCSALFPFLKKQYNMTQAEWDALTTAEKLAMAGQNVAITDDEGTQTFEEIIPSDASSTNKLTTKNSTLQTIQLSGVVDCNTLTEPGLYTASAGAVSTLTNAPTSEAVQLSGGFSILVTKTNTDSIYYGMQLFIPYGSDLPSIRKSYYLNGQSWTSWKQLATDEWEYNYKGAFTGALSGTLYFKRKNGIDYTGIALDDTSTTIGWKTVTVPSLASIPSFSQRIHGYLMGTDGNSYGMFSATGTTALSFYFNKDSGGDDIGFNLQWYISIDI